jgi:predicted HicB family RNase H-like nuclease
MTKIINVRIPADLHQQIRIQAIKQNITLPKIIINALEEYLSRKKE